MQGLFYFKVAKTTDSKTYEYPTNAPVAEFIDAMKQNIIQDFGQIYGFTHESEFELVRAGQSSSHIQRAEDAPAVDLSQITGSVYKNYKNSESFYIRLLSATSCCSTYSCNINSAGGGASASDNASASTISSSIPESSPHECGICYTQSTLQPFHECGHLLCKICYHDCRLNGHIVCPVCRAAPL